MQRLGTPFSGVLYAGLMIDPAGEPVGGRVQLPSGRSRGPGGAAPGLRRAHRRLSAGGAREATVSPGKMPAARRSRPSSRPGATPMRRKEERTSRSRMSCPTASRSSTPERRETVAGGSGRAEDRVLTVTAVAASFTEAQRLSREAAEAVRFEGKIFRRDIGWREAARLDERSRRAGRLRRPLQEVPCATTSSRSASWPQRIARLRRRRAAAISLTRAIGRRTASASWHGRRPREQTAFAPSPITVSSERGGSLVQ